MLPSGGGIYSLKEKKRKKEAQIDKKILSLFNNVTLQEDTAVEKQLAKLQMTIKHDKSNSWFIHVKKTLLKYELCEIQNYIDQPIKKTVWKKL